MMETTNISNIEFESEDFKCTCGNTTCDSGFFPCDAKGNEIEPTKEEGWSGLYVCAECGIIYSVE